MSRQVQLRREARSSAQERAILPHSLIALYTDELWACGYTAEVGINQVHITRISQPNVTAATLSGKRMHVRRRVPQAMLAMARLGPLHKSNSSSNSQGGGLVALNAVTASVCILFCPIPVVPLLMGTDSASNATTTAAECHDLGNFCQVCLQHCSTSQDCATLQQLSGRK